MQYELFGNMKNLPGRKLILPSLLAGLLITGMAPELVLSQEEERAAEAEQVWQQAIGLNLQGEWVRALALFRQVAAGDSPRAAEAAFYSGLCLENIPDRDVEAFQAFAELRSRFQGDPITSKAISHQITLAGMLGESDSFYR
ncbi:tol-pal system YbgF family protein, partial [Gemmatimonadota bacterium]